MSGRKECKICRKEIDVKAKICCHCNSYQNFLIRNLKLFETSIIIIISIIALTFSYIQLKQAEKETIKANEAKTLAEQALEKTKIAYGEVNKLTSDNIDIEKNINANYSEMLELKNENIAYKNYQIKLMNSSSYASCYIYLNDRNQFFPTQTILPHNYYLSQFLSELSFNEAVLRGERSNSEKIPIELHYDVFELSFFEWYNKLYFGNWYRVDDRLSNMGGGSSLPNVENTIVVGDSLIEKMHYNKALQYLKKKFANCRIFLPPSSKILITQSRQYLSQDSTNFHFLTKILIENKIFNISIDLDCYKVFSLNEEFNRQLFGIDKYFNINEKVNAMELRVFAKLNVKKNIIFDENTAKLYYWAKQLLESIDKLSTIK